MCTISQSNLNIIAYLLIINMYKKNTKKDLTKKETINLRVSLEEKVCIEHKAKRNNSSTSSYIRNAALKDTSSVLNQIPQSVDLWNLANDIYHTVDAYNNYQLSMDIKNILDQYLNLEENNYEQ